MRSIGLIYLGVVSCLLSQLYVAKALHGGDVIKVFSGRYKYVVAFAHFDDGQSGLATQFCTGSLITSQTVLTAYKCLAQKKPRDIVVYIGDEGGTGSNLDKTDPYAVLRWNSQSPREQENVISLDIDIIAIATLNRKVGFGIALRQSKFKWPLVRRLNKLWIVGWQRWEVRARQLQSRVKAQVQLLDQDTCMKLTEWQPIKYGSYFCTSGGQAEINMGTVDYGSPLMVVGDCQRSIIIGVTVRVFPLMGRQYRSVIVHANTTKLFDFNAYHSSEH